MRIEFNLQSLPYQSFLIAIFIGISIYKPNRMFFPPEVMILPMGIIFFLIGITLFISNKAGWDMNRAQILLSCGLLLNFNYYTLYEAPFGRWLNISPVDIIYLLVFILLIAIVSKTTSLQAEKLSGVLNIIAIFALLISIVSLGLSIVSGAKEAGDVEQKQAFETQFQIYLMEDLNTSLGNRDFYFIILDRYPGEDTMNAQYGFNDSNFYQNLSAVGFNILLESRSNYAGTDVSIPSMLNMDYFDSVREAGYDEEYNRLWKFFKSQGFRFVFLPSNWHTTVENENADMVLNPFPIKLHRNPQSIFRKIMFVERTLIGKIYYSLKHALFNAGMPSSSITDLKFRIREGLVNEFNEERANEELVGPLGIHVRHTFDNLTEVPRIAGKKFVFAHINNWENVPQETTNYTETLQSANQVIESTVRRIIIESQVAPVIVLLSDHGIVPSLDAVERKRAVFEKYIHYPNKSLDQEYIDASGYTVNNFEAFYLPAGGNTCIYPNMTPVNAWRMILNYYFGIDFPRTAEKSYYWFSPNEEYRELNSSDQKLTCT